MLSTDLTLDKEQAQALRDCWNEQSKGLHAGGGPILSHGLKVSPWVAPAVPKDLQLAELLKLIDDHIALVFRICNCAVSAPRRIGSTQTLMSFWLASGLDFLPQSHRQAFEHTDHCEFDTAALRSDQKDRIEAPVRGIQGDICSANEARNQEGFDDVPYGEPSILCSSEAPRFS